MSASSGRPIPGEFKQITPKTKTLPNKRLNEQNNGFAQALILITQVFFTVVFKTILSFMFLHLELNVVVKYGQHGA